MKKIIILPLLYAASAMHAQTGNVGIGTTAPTASLHVKAVSPEPYIIRIEDATNTDSENYIIKSADNFGTFAKIPSDAFRATTVLTLPANGVTISTAYPSFQNSGIAVTVPPGKWAMSGTIALIPSNSMSTNGTIGYNGRMSLADTPTSTASSSDLISVYPTETGAGNMFGRVLGPAPKDFLTGMIYINNASGANKTYYLLANIERLGGGTDNFRNFGDQAQQENLLYLTPINDN